MFKFILSLLFIFFNVILYANNLNVGYSNAAMQQFSAKDVTIATNVWLQQLVKNTPHTVTFSFYTSKGLAKAAKEGKADYLSAYGLSYVKYFDLSQLKDAFTGGSKNRKDENLILVLRKGTTLASLLKMKRPHITFLGGNELAQLYINYIFLEHKNYTKIFFTPKRTNYRALLDLFFNKVDAAVVMKKTFAYATELNPQIAKVLYIAKKTNLCAGNFGFFSKKVPANFRNEIQKLALSINHKKEGKQVLDIFRTSAVIETKIADLKPIEELYNNYIKLKKKEKNKK